MYQKILHFIKYHNAVTIVFVMVFFGFGVSYAASPAVRDSVYSSEETVVSVDNYLIVSADLDNFNFNLRINSVTEDEKKYYTVYSYQTLAIEDGVWQNKEIEKTLKVNKEALDGKDLGLYVEEELGENIKYELSYLKRVQKLEKEKGESQKVVAVEYSGLIGKLLNSKENVIEGYVPVITPVITEVPKPTAAIVPTPSQPSLEAPAGTAKPQATSQPEAPARPSGGGPPLAETPVSEPATSTLEVIPEPVIEATSTPEVIPEPVIEATSTPEISQEPVTESTSTLEVVPSQ